MNKREEKKPEEMLRESQESHHTTNDSEKIYERGGIETQSNNYNFRKKIMYFLRILSRLVITYLYYSGVHKRLNVHLYKKYFQFSF